MKEFFLQLTDTSVEEQMTRELLETITDLKAKEKLAKLETEALKNELLVTNSQLKQDIEGLAVDTTLLDGLREIRQRKEQAQSQMKELERNYEESLRNISNTLRMEWDILKREREEEQKLRHQLEIKRNNIALLFKVTRVNLLQDSMDSNSSTLGFYIKSDGTCRPLPRERKFSESPNNPSFIWDKIEEIENA